MAARWVGAVLVSVVLAGCLPLVTPPGRLSTRFGYAGTHVPEHADDGSVIREKGGSTFEGRLSVNPLTASSDHGRLFDFGIGGFFDKSLGGQSFAHYGPYAEVSLLPWHLKLPNQENQIAEVGVTLAVERVQSGGTAPPGGVSHGYGVMLSSDIRVITTGRVVNEHTKLFYGYGEAGIGFSFGLAVRNVDDQMYAMLSFGIEMELPAGAGIISFW